MSQNEESQEVDEKAKVSKSFLFFLFLGCIVLCTGGWWLTYILSKTNIFAEKQEIASQFGDSFGAVNALISSLAFAGLIYSMYLQRKDLENQFESIKLQRNELKANTAELEGQKKQLEQQNENLKIQRFENTFFNMMNLQQEIIDTLTIFRNDKESKGRAVFSILIDVLHQELDTSRIVFNISNPSNKLNKRLSNYDLNSDNYFSILDHYFLHLYRIIKFVDETNLLSDNSIRYEYVSILRATLSREEITFLFVNELNPRFKKFKVLIEKYSLFNNINWESIPVDLEYSEYCLGNNINYRDNQNKEYFYTIIKGYYEESAYTRHIE